MIIICFSITIRNISWGVGVVFKEEMINVSTRMYLIPYSEFITNTSIRMENSLAISVAIRDQGNRVLKNTN